MKPNLETKWAICDFVLTHRNQLATIWVHERANETA